MEVAENGSAVLFSRMVAPRNQKEHTPPRESTGLWFLGFPELGR